jgi:hypothetical protein
MFRFHATLVRGGESFMTRASQLVIDVLPIVYEGQSSAVSFHSFVKHAANTPSTFNTAALRNESISATLESPQQRFSFCI